MAGRVFGRGPARLSQLHIGASTGRKLSDGAGLLFLLSQQWAFVWMDFLFGWIPFEERSVQTPYSRPSSLSFEVQRLLCFRAAGLPLQWSPPFALSPPRTHRKSKNTEPAVGEELQKPLRILGDPPDLRRAVAASLKQGISSVSQDPSEASLLPPEKRKKSSVWAETLMVVNPTSVSRGQ